MPWSPTVTRGPRPVPAGACQVARPGQGGRMAGLAVRGREGTAGPAAAWVLLLPHAVDSCAVGWSLELL